MKTALRLVALLLVLIGLVPLIGWMLPVEHVAAGSARFAQAPDAIYEVVADVEHYPAWWRDVSRVEMLPTVNGKPRFREHSSDGTIVMEIEEASPPNRFVTRIADPGQPFGGTWTFEIVPSDGGSRLTITERGEIYNPVFRFMARFIFGYTGTIESFLAALESRLAPPR